MKKLFYLLMVMFLPVVCLAQDGGDAVGSGILEFLGTLAGVAGIVLPVTGWIKTLFKWEDGAARFLSWIVAIAIGVFGYFVNVGIFENIGILASILTGFAAGLVANGVFTIEIVKTILEWINAQIPKKS